MLLDVFFHGVLPALLMLTAPALILGANRSNRAGKISIGMAIILDFVSIIPFAFGTGLVITQDGKTGLVIGSILVVLGLAGYAILFIGVYRIVSYLRNTPN